MQRKIVVVGSINLDMVATVERLPLAGETISGLGFATYAGGKGANQAVGAARLGAAVEMIGRLGEDVFAGQLRASLRDAGVDERQVGTVAGPSGSAVILTSAAGENSIVVIGGANQRLTPEELQGHAKTFEGAAIVLAQLETPIETIVALGALTSKQGVPFVLDPAPVCLLPDELLRTVTWLTPNETEAALLMKQIGEEGVVVSRVEDARRVAQALLQRGVRNVLIKMGARGVYLEGQDVASVFVPAFAVKAVDSTAAGDAFNGAFAYALAVRAMGPVEAAEFACAAAAVSVTRAGAQPSMPTLGEVEEMIGRGERVRFREAQGS